MSAGAAAFDIAKWQAHEVPPSTAPGVAPAVLVAEDNRILGKVIVKILEQLRLRAHHVAQGKEALDALLAHDFALALIDINLPGMSGLEVATHYRFAAIGRKRIPILGLVGGDMAQSISACIDAGMDACLPKPLDPAHLVEAVRSFLPIAAKAENAAAKDAAGALLLLTGPAAVEADPVEADTASSDVPAINLQVLKDLEQLGGRQFVEDVVSQFVADAKRVFPDLEDAIRKADVQLSRDLLHALRSCAANVGATAIYEFCLAWREIDLQELVERGETCLSRLQEAFEEARELMRDFEPAGTKRELP